MGMENIGKLSSIRGFKFSQHLETNEIVPFFSTSAHHVEHMAIGCLHSLFSQQLFMSTCQSPWIIDPSLGLHGERKAAGGCWNPDWIPLIPWVPRGCHTQPHEVPFCFLDTQYRAHPMLMATGRHVRYRYQQILRITRNQEHDLSERWMYFRNVQILASNSDFGALKATITEVLESRDGIYGVFGCTVYGLWLSIP